MTSLVLLINDIINDVNKQTNKQTPLHSIICFQCMIPANPIRVAVIRRVQEPLQAPIRVYVKMVPPLPRYAKVIHPPCRHVVVT